MVTLVPSPMRDLRAVSPSYYEGALALGATHERSVYTAVVPAASSGILAGIVLGIGRAMGETMAVIMVAGNQPRMPKGILQGVRTLTGNIVIEMGYAAGLHREALIATGVVLFVFILLVIDRAIESGTDKAKYDKFCEQERQNLYVTVVTVCFLFLGDESRALSVNEQGTAFLYIMQKRIKICRL